MNTCSLISLYLITLVCSARTRSHKHPTGLRLAFPKGSAFTVTLAMSTFLPKDIVPKKALTGYGHVVEYDLTYSFPEEITFEPKPPPPKKKKKEKKKIAYGPIYPDYIIDYPQKRSVPDMDFDIRATKELRKFFAFLGHDGDACLTRLTCEVQQWTNGNFLLDDIILALVPRYSTSACQDSYQLCTFSPLQLLHHSELLDQTIPREIG